ncbi:hypothetical protein MASR2M79_17000 [Aminivibrio sp.]
MKKHPEGDSSGSEYRPRYNFAFNILVGDKGLGHAVEKSSRGVDRPKEKIASLGPSPVADT